MGRCDEAIRYSTCPDCGAFSVSEGTFTIINLVDDCERHVEVSGMVCQYCASCWTMHEWHNLDGPSHETDMDDKEIQ